MTAAPAPTTTGMGRPARRVGYIIGAAVNGVFIYVANNLLDWDAFPWLTAEFADVLPAINVSLVAGVIVNLLYVANDSVRVKSTGDIVTAVIALVVAARVWAVFPFDFSPYSFRWAATVRVILGVTMAVLVIAVIASIFKVVTAEKSPS